MVFLGFFRDLLGFNGDFMVIYGDLMGFMGIYSGYNGIYHHSILPIFSHNHHFLTRCSPDIT
jgi:hypothetical protein